MASCSHPPLHYASPCLPTAVLFCALDLFYVPDGPVGFAEGTGREHRYVKVKQIGERGGKPEDEKVGWEGKSGCLKYEIFGDAAPASSPETDSGGSTIPRGFDDSNEPARIVVPYQYRYASPRRGANSRYVAEEAEAGLVGNEKIERVGGGGEWQVSRPSITVSCPGLLGATELELSPEGGGNVRFPVGRIEDAKVVKWVLGAAVIAGSAWMAKAVWAF